MLFALIVFLSLLALCSVMGGAYLVGAWLVQNRPDSPLGKLLKGLPMYTTYHEQGQQEEEGTQERVRESAVPKAALTASQRRKSFRTAEAPRDSMKVTFPDDGSELIMKVLGTLRMNELIQRDDSSARNPWFSTSQKFVFQILKGRRNAWVMEMPGILTLVTKIEQVGDGVIKGFVPAAQAFGPDQSATHHSIRWEGQKFFLFDIGRLGLHTAVGDTPTWNVAPEDPKRDEWDDDFTVKFILAGPNGGKNAKHEVEEDFLCVITPVNGTGGYVLTGKMIDEKYLTIQEEG